MSPDKNRVTPSPVEVAQGEVERLGQQLDELEVLPDWSDELEARRQALLKQYAAALRAVEDAALEEQLGPGEEPGA